MFVLWSNQAATPRLNLALFLLARRRRRLIQPSMASQGGALADASYGVMPCLL